MLRHNSLIHPKINEVLGRAGHHAKILISDGNYPASTTLGPNAELVSLNLAPGIVTVAQVLDVLCTAIPIETIHTMGIPEDDPYAQDEPPVWQEFRDILKKHEIGLDLDPISKWEFYDAVASSDHALTIQTADQALWANVLFSVGVRQA